MFHFFQKKQKGDVVHFKIKGMHCPSCAINIDGTLEEIEGVLSAQTSYAQSKITVEFDPAKVSVEQMKEAVQREGYTLFKNEKTSKH